MGTVSFRVPEDVKAEMEEHPEVNWSAALRRFVSEKLEELHERDLAKAVLVSERLSRYAGEKGARDIDTTSIIQDWRERRYGPEEDDD